MELHVVVFIFCWIKAASKVYWTVPYKPVIYGDNIILTCKTYRRGACRVRQWFGGPKNKLLLYNKGSVDATKYEDRTNLSSTEFSLVIKNYTESDLNINYTCSCGFQSYTKRLGLNDEDFIVPPLRVNTHIQQSNETLSIYLHVERVYPRPQCSVVIGERTVFDKLTLTSVKRGMFYYGTYEASFNIVDDDCGKKPTLLCYIGNEYSIVNTSGEPIRNCTGTVPPLRVETYIQQSNEALSIYLHVERIYPRPECSIAIGERTIFDNLTLTSVKRDVFYYATYEASINIVADDCGKKPTLLCYIGNEHIIVNASGEPIRNCTGVSDGSSGVSGYLVPLFLLIIAFVFCDCPVLSSLYRNRAKIWNHLNSDLLSRDCWDWRRPVLAIALTVIVFIIDAFTKVYSTKYLVNEVNGDGSDDNATPVGLCVLSLLLTPLSLCLISTPDTVSIREGFRVAGSRFDIKKMIPIPCKEYREVPLGENNVNSSSDTL